MTETLPRLLLQLSEAGRPALLPGHVAAPYFGREFDRLLGSRVLIEQGPLDTWTPCPSCECDLGYRTVQTVDGKFVAVCPLNAAEDVPVNATDLRQFEIDIDAVIRRLAMAADMSAEPEPLGRGVWLIGSLPGGDAAVLLQDELAANDPSLLSVLHLRLGQQRSVVLHPERILTAIRRSLSDAGHRCVVTTEVIRSDWSLDIGALRAPALLPRLVIGRAAKSVKLDGVERQIPDQPFRLLSVLAEAAVTGLPIVDVRDIERRMWEDRVVPPTWTVRDVVRELKKGLETRSRNPEKDKQLVKNFRRPNSSYGLQLAPGEIAISN